MPGVYDCHLHVAPSSLSVGEALATPITQWTLEAAHNARVTLEAGVTFVRDLGGAGRGIRDAIALGLAPILAGPRFQVSSGYLMPDYPGKPTYLVDGPGSMTRAVRIAKEYGVKLALGTDYINREQHGNNLEEIALMHDAGLTVEEALLAATIRGAELCGVDDRYRRIAAGYVFDAVGLDGDPGDLSRFRSSGAASGVFKSGLPVVSHTGMSDLGAAAAE